MSQKTNEELLRLPQLSRLQEGDIPQKAGEYGSEETPELLRLRGKAEQTILTTADEVEEHKSLFAPLGMDSATLREDLERLQRVRAFRSELEQSLRITHQAEMILADGLADSLYKTYNGLQGFERSLPNLKGQFTDLRAYMKAHGRSRKKNDDVEDPS